MTTNKTTENLAEFARQIRCGTLRQFRALGSGHVGGSLSVADLLAVLYGCVMHIDPDKPRMEGRDQLVMSKGHAGPALYATLALKGYFPLDLLDTLNRNGTLLPSHCDRRKTPGVDMTTGSLGQGMSSAIGIALAGKMKKDGSYCYLVLGDGECDEVQVWEGALFAAHHRVSNLIAFVDRNTKQLDGFTEDICALGDVRRKFEEFGWHAQEANGHDCRAILDAIEQTKAQSDRPAMVVLHTVKGKGTEFAETAPANHHMAVTAERIDEALGRLAAEREGGR